MGAQLLITAVSALSVLSTDLSELRCYQVPEISQLPSEERIMIAQSRAKTNQNPSRERTEAKLSYQKHGARAPALSRR